MTKVGFLKIGRWQFKSQSELDSFYELASAVGLPTENFLETPQFLIFRPMDDLEDFDKAALAMADLGYNVEVVAGSGLALRQARVPPSPKRIEPTTNINTAIPESSQEKDVAAQEPLEKDVASIPEKRELKTPAPGPSEGRKLPPPLPSTAVEKAPLVKPTKRASSPSSPTAAEKIALPVPQSKQAVPPLPNKEVKMGPPSPRLSTKTAPPPLPDKEAAIVPPLPPSKQAAPPLPNKEAKMPPPPRPATQTAAAPSQNKAPEMPQRTPPPRRSAPPALPNSDVVGELQAPASEEIVSAIEDFHTTDGSRLLGLSDDGALIDQYEVKERATYESSGGNAKITILAVLLLIISGLSYYWFFVKERTTGTDQNDSADNLVKAQDGQGSNRADIQAVTSNQTSPARKSSQMAPQSREVPFAETKNSAPSETAANLASSTEAPPRTQSIPMIDESRGPIPRTSPASWFKLSDIPERKKANGLQTSISYTLTIGINGEVIGCKASESSAQGIADIFCGKATSRAKFDPAQGQNGKPVIGEYQSAMRINVTVKKAEPKSGCFERGASGLVGTIC
jgi:hypothetical protein